MSKRLFIPTLILAAAGCSNSDTVTAPAERFELVWSDEFDGEAGLPPDGTRWTFDIGIGPNNDGWGNGQLEFVTDLPDNVSLDGEGNLAITARQLPVDERVTFLDRAYTAGRITTKDRYATRYGRIEARMLLPKGRGIWPAFWMLGDTFPEEAWPGAGEIDIMEFRGQDNKAVYANVHGPGYCGSPFDCGTGPVGGAFRFDGPLGFEDKFHVFAVEWDEERIAWFVDDQVYATVQPSAIAAAGGTWVFDEPFFLLLNLAVGGSFALEDPDATTPFPSTLLVDYVRVYKRVRGSDDPIEVVDIDDGVRDVPTPSALVVEPSRVVFGVGGLETLFAQDEANDRIPNGIEWTSNAPEVARVGATGVVYGTMVGSATITASINGLTDTVLVTVSSTIAPPGRIQLPMAADDHYRGRSSFGAVVGQVEGGPPLHTEDALCPRRADDNPVGSCHRVIWDGRDSQGGTSPAFTGDFWTIGGAFMDLQSAAIQLGATAVTFVAWGEVGGETITFGAGLLPNDIGTDTQPFTLTTEPTRYTVSFANLLGYDEVFSPFTWSTDNGANPDGFTFYVDDIEWVTPAQMGGN